MRRSWLVVVLALAAAVAATVVGLRWSVRRRAGASSSAPSTRSSPRALPGAIALVRDGNRQIVVLVNRDESLPERAGQALERVLATAYCG